MRMSLTINPAKSRSILPKKAIQIQPLGYYAKQYTDARLAAALTPANSVAHVFSAYYPSHAHCPVPLTRSTVSGTCIETTLLLIPPCTSIHPIYIPAGTGKRWLAVGGHALVSGCPKHWTIQYPTINLRPC